MLKLGTHSARAVCLPDSGFKVHKPTYSWDSVFHLGLVIPYITYLVSQWLLPMKVSSYILLLTVVCSFELELSKRAFRMPSLSGLSNSFGKLKSSPKVSKPKEPAAAPKPTVAVKTEGVSKPTAAVLQKAQPTVTGHAQRTEPADAAKAATSTQGALKKYGGRVLKAVEVGGAGLLFVNVATPYIKKLIGKDNGTDVTTSVTATSEVQITTSLENCVIAGMTELASGAVQSASAACVATGGLIVTGGESLLTAAAATLALNDTATASATAASAAATSAAVLASATASSDGSTAVVTGTSINGVIYAAESDQQDATSIDGAVYGTVASTDKDTTTLLPSAGSPVAPVVAGPTVASQEQPAALNVASTDPAALNLASTLTTQFTPGTLTINGALYIKKQ